MSESLGLSSIKPFQNEAPELVIETQVELDSNLTQIRVEQPEFPLTRRQCGKLLDVSDVSVGKWIKAIEAVGVSCTNSKGRITERGLELLQGVSNRPRSRNLFGIFKNAL